RARPQRQQQRRRSRMIARPAPRAAMRAEVAGRRVPRRLAGLRFEGTTSPTSNPGHISPTGGTYMTDDTNPIQSVKRRLSRRNVLKSASAAALVGVAAPHVARAAAMPEVDSSFKDFTLPNSSCDESLLKIQHKGEIVVGTSGDWPYSFFPANTTEWTGLDADIIRYVAKMLKIPKITVQTTPFSGLIPGLLDGRFDIVGDSIHWTLGRAKVADFCFPTYYYSEWLAVKKG